MGYVIGFHPKPESHAALAFAAEWENFVFDRDHWMISPMTIMADAVDA